MRPHMRSRSRPCRRPALRRLRPPRSPRWYRQRKSPPNPVAAPHGKRSITRRQIPIMTSGGIRTRRPMSAPHRTKSLYRPQTDPSGPAGGPFLFVCVQSRLTCSDPLASATQEQLDSQFWFDRTIEKFTTTLRIVPPCKELLGSARFQSRNAGLPRRISRV